MHYHFDVEDAVERRQNKIPILYQNFENRLGPIENTLQSTSEVEISKNRVSYSYSKIFIILSSIFI
jgi:hypothetical protein